MSSNPSSLSSPSSPSLRPSGQARGGAPHVLAAAALWGTTGTVASFAPPAASPLSIGAATMGLGGLLTLALAGRSAFAVLRGGRGQLVHLLTGAVGVVVYPLAFYLAMDLAGVAVGTVVCLGSAPVFAALLDRLLYGGALTARWAAATTAATGGCAVLVLDGHGAAGDRVAAGVAAGLLSGAAYAVYTSCASALIRHGHTARATMGALFGLGACVLLPLFAATGGALLAEPRGIAVAAYLALVPMCLAYALFGAGLTRVRASAATTLTLFEPVVAAVLSVAVVGERFGAVGWVGVGLVVLGLLVLTARAPRRPRAAAGTGG
ncbi:EamA family transporter [Streptomyces avicenniae]|uniref:EamA family transporter n=1 Tax=Streptomyces avicenniae TaxID=500153 RepID=UPI00069ACAA5|nr:EamA family transporter [Streptomyces avicenniae]